MSQGPCACGAPSGAPAIEKPSSLRLRLTYYQAFGLGLYRGEVGIELPDLGIRINGLRHFGVPGEPIGWPTRHIINQSNGSLTPAPKGRSKANQPHAIRLNDGGWWVTPVVEFVDEKFRRLWETVVERAVVRYLREVQ